MPPAAARPLGVLVSGEGTNLQALLDADLPVAAVAADRPCRAVERARAAGVPAEVFPPRGRTAEARAAHDAEIAAFLDRHGVGAVVLAGYLRILGPAFIARYRGRIVNVHPALLPAFQGLHAQRRALEAGVKETGVTVHLVDESLDGGPVIFQERAPVLSGDTEETLSARLRPIEHRLLVEAARRLAAGEAL